MKPAQGPSIGEAQAARPTEKVGVMTTKLELQPELPHATTIACEACGAPARLSDARLDMQNRKFQETWTYVCEACGRTMARNVDC